MDIKALINEPSKSINYSLFQDLLLGIHNYSIIISNVHTFNINYN